jgi:transcription elongation factor GreB
MTSAQVWICDSFWMSRAFIREDVDPPERSGRRRAASGLPPGAVNYITERGAARLQGELTRLRAAGDNAEHVAKLERILGSVTVVDSPDAQSQSVSFGATVTLSDTDGTTETYTVVGVDELDFEPDAVSWISPIGKALLASELGDRIALEDGRSTKIVKIE